MSLFQKIFMGVCALLLLVPLAAQAVSINEIRIDNVSSDTDEYFELAGTPGMSLDGYTYIVIGDGTGGSGTIESVTDLTGQTIQADGFLAVHKAGTTGVCSGYDVDLTLSFENSDNVTHMLVTGFSGAKDDDIDADDDGVIDNAPWGAIVECVGLVETVGSGDLLYCDTLVGPDGSFVPGHVFKCGDSWFIGTFDGTLGLCVDTLDTPGESNSSSCAVPNEETSWGSMKSRF